MWKITIFSVIMFTLVLIEVTPKSNTVEDYRLHCNKICNNTGATAHFDEESLHCKCILVQNITDSELILMKKNAKFLNLQLEPVKTRSRRYISSQHYNKLLPHADSSDEFHDHIVGQAPLLPSPAGRPLAPHRHRVRYSNEAAAERMKKIRKNLDRLLDHPAARNAAGHAEAVRKHLRELSHQIISPEQRARMRSRDRQRFQRLNSRNGKGLHPARRAGLLGAAPSDALTTSPPQETKRKHNKNLDNGEEPENDSGKSHSGIITQPEEYIDD